MYSLGLQSNDWKRNPSKTLQNVTRNAKKVNVQGIALTSTKKELSSHSRKWFGWEKSYNVFVQYTNKIDNKEINKVTKKRGLQDTLWDDRRSRPVDCNLYLVA